MKWFDNWFANKCKQAWENSQQDDREEVNYPVPRMRSRKNVGLATAGSPIDHSDLQSTSTTFKLYQANGGTVIETRHYNDNKEQWDTSLHIVPKSEELGKAIEHIITYEALKR